MITLKINFDYGIAGAGISAYGYDIYEVIEKADAIIAKDAKFLFEELRFIDYKLFRNGTLRDDGQRIEGEEAEHLEPLVRTRLLAKYKPEWYGNPDLSPRPPLDESSPEYIVASTRIAVIEEAQDQLAGIFREELTAEIDAEILKKIDPIEPTSQAINRALLMARIALKGAHLWAGSLEMAFMEAQEALRKKDEDVSKMWRKFEEGMLHRLVCNNQHDPVGSPGCSCPYIFRSSHAVS